jgi:hypothetical protein
MTAHPSVNYAGWVDTTAVVMAFGSLGGYLPEIAAGMSIVMMSCRAAWVIYKFFKQHWH